MKITKIKSSIFLSVLSLAILSFSCKKDDNDPVDTPPPTEEQELITTFQLTLTDTSGTHPTMVVTFRDLDGPGGNAPTTFDTIRLQANTVYMGVVELLNEAVTPAVNISDEVMEEAADHLFCYAVSGANTTVSITDSFNSLPIGLTTSWTTGDPSTGSILIRLKHQPGIKTGSCDLGETDIELDFQLVVQ